MARRPSTKKRSTRGKSKGEKVLWGRPRAYERSDEFEKECRAYFKALKWNAPNIAGIVVFLGISRDTWERYRKQKDFCGTIMNVEYLIESWWVNRLKMPGAGAIFYLKNFRSDIYKERTPGDADNPFISEVRITGMRVSKDTSARK